MATIRPGDEAELCEAVRQAAPGAMRLDIRGGGSKAAIGAAHAATVLDMSGFRGIVDYDPAELVLTVRAGTPLVEVQNLLAAHDQMLAFDPWDHGPLFGAADSMATIGGIIAAGVAGPRRLSTGGARDHLLGFTAVSGRGERFVAGGKVVKNVTGFDLSKLVTGSWGRLVALTELSLKVLPRPRVSLSLAAEGLTAALARTLLTDALGGQAAVAAAAFLPPLAGHRDRSVTLLRIEGFGPSVEARAATLIAGSGHALAALGEEEAIRLWQQVQVPAQIRSSTLWRAQLPASAGFSLLEEVEQLGGHCMLDWGGGQLWIGWDGDPHLIRPAVEAVGGHTMLVRATAEVRQLIPAHHPHASGIAALEARLRHAFDPHGVFETGRFS